MRVQLAPDPRSAAAARRAASDFLATLGPPTPVDPDDVLLTVSELVTNALEAGAGQIHLELVHRGGAVTIRVEDDGDGWPSVHHPDEREERGRGLGIVEYLAAHWQVDRTATGKAVVATLRSVR